MYINVKRINLLKIQNEYFLYNLIRVIKKVDLIFTSFYELYLKKKIRKKINILILFNLIKLFQNYIQINRIEFKTSSYKAFITLQEDSTEIIT